MKDKVSTQFSISMTKTLPCLADKFVFELSNSLNVIQDHNRVQAQQRSLKSRLINAFTGESARRQNHINQNLQSGLEASLSWLQELTEQNTLCFLAVERANQAITQLADHILILEQYGAETRELIEKLEYRFESSYQQICYRLDTMDAKDKATDQIDYLMSAWKAGDLNQFPIAIRLYIVLERLYWGDYGDYRRRYADLNSKQWQEFEQTLHNKIVIMLKEDAKLEHGDFKGIAFWYDDSHMIDWQNAIVTEESLTAHSPEASKTTWGDAIGYLSDWSNPINHPLTFSVSQPIHKLCHLEEAPLHLPRILTPERLAKRCLKEIFEDRL